MQTVEAILRAVEQVPDFYGQTITAINQRNRYGDTPLHIVAFWGDCHAIQTLVKAGADINAKGEHGYTPLMQATGKGRFKVLKLLIRLGAQPIENSEGDRPSDIAEYLNHRALHKWLRAKGF